VTITARSPKHRARLTSQGQVTVPKPVRDFLGAKPGDDLEFEQTRGGFLIRHRPRISVLDFAGMAADRALQMPQTAEALDALLARTANKRATDRNRALVSRDRARR
jgi:antitoxin PrlF